MRRSRRLRPGGRLVANAVTLEMEAMLLARHARLGGELVAHRRVARRAGRHDARLAAGHAGHAMVVGEAMIVAGIGCRKGVAADEVLAAIDAALARARSVARPDRPLATGPIEARRAGALRGQRGDSGVPLVIVDDDALHADGVRTLTHSAAFAGR